jgi:uncharacterized membrane protein YkvA (DUF1232 family)
MKFLNGIAHNVRVHGHTVWLCARDRDVAWPVRLLALMIAGYALSPIDLIPDFIPVIGLLDDAVLIPLGLWLLRRMVADNVYARNRAIAQAASMRPVSRLAAACIIAIWIVAAVSIAYGITVWRSGS